MPKYSFVEKDKRYLSLEMSDGKTYNLPLAGSMKLKELRKLVHIQKLDEVEQFDRQMQSQPIMQIKTDITETMFLTMDYVGMKYFYVGDQQYRFARRKDIAGLDFCKTSSTGANPMRASYFFDVKGTGNEKLLSGVAETGKTLEKLEALLKEVNPDLVVTKKRTM